MIDVTTNEPIQVLQSQHSGPYLQVPYAQVPDIQRVLNEHGIYHWVWESVISVNDGPEFGTVAFGRAGKRDEIQAALDTDS